MDMLTYLCFRRLFIFLDEWLFYFSIYYLYFILEEKVLAIFITAIGFTMITYSYESYGRIEEGWNIYERPAPKTQLKRN